MKLSSYRAQHVVRLPGCTGAVGLFLKGSCVFSTATCPRGLPNTSPSSDTQSRQRGAHRGTAPRPARAHEGVQVPLGGGARPAGLEAREVLSARVGRVRRSPEGRSAGTLQLGCVHQGWRPGIQAGMSPLGRPAPVSGQPGSLLPTSCWDKSHGSFTPAVDERAGLTRWRLYHASVDFPVSTGTPDWGPRGA